MRYAYPPYNYSSIQPDGSRNLFLGKSTSELDDTDEGFIEDNLRRLGVGRVIIDHRQGIIRRGDRVPRLAPADLETVAREARTSRALA